MAISRISSQDASGSGAGASCTATYPGATTVGNLLIAAGTCLNNGLNNISISGWTKVGDETISSSGNGSVALFYKLADGTEAIITMSAPGGTCQLDIFEYTGNANPISTDGTAAINTSGTTTEVTWASPSITTANANDLIIIASGQQSNSTTSNAWAGSTLIGLNQLQSGCPTLLLGEKIVAATQSGYTDTLNWTTASRVSMVIGAFQAAASGTTTSTSSTSVSSTSSSTSTSTSISSTSSSVSTSTSQSSTSHSTSTSSTSTSISSTSSSTSTSRSTSTSSTSSSISTSSTSSSISTSTSSTSASTSISSTSASTSISTSTSSTSSSTSRSTSTSLSSTSSSTSQTFSTSTSSTSASTSSTSNSTSSTTTLPFDPRTVGKFRQPILLR